MLLKIVGLSIGWFALSLLLMVLVGAAGAYFAHTYTQDKLQNDTRAELYTLARVKSADVQGSFELVQQAVYGVAAHMQLAPDNVTASGKDSSGFEVLAKAAIHRHPSVLAVGWLEANPARSARPLVHLQEGAKARQKPFENNFRKFMGFDFATDAQWLSTMRAAAQTKQLQVSYQGLGAGSTAQRPLFQHRRF